MHKACRWPCFFVLFQLWPARERERRKCCLQNQKLLIVVLKLAHVHVCSLISLRLVQVVQDVQDVQDVEESYFILLDPLKRSTWFAHFVGFSKFSKFLSCPGLSVGNGPEAVAFLEFRGSEMLRDAQRCSEMLRDAQRCSEGSKIKVFSLWESTQSTLLLYPIVLWLKRMAGCTNDVILRMFVKLFPWTISRKQESGSLHFSRARSKSSLHRPSDQNQTARAFSLFAIFAPIWSICSIWSHFRLWTSGFVLYRLMVVLQMILWVCCFLPKEPATNAKTVKLQKHLEGSFKMLWKCFQCADVILRASFHIWSFVPNSTRGAVWRMFAFPV